MKDIRTYLKENKIVADGAFGTYYQQLSESAAGIPEAANITEKELVKKIHKEYMKAGAKLIRTNSFAANTVSLKEDIAYVKAVVKASYENAVEAVRESGKEVYIAADIGPIPQMAFEDEAEIEKEYFEVVDTFLSCGADIFCFETFSDIRYINILAEYIKEKCSNAFIVVQFSLNKYGYTQMGIRAERIFNEASQEEAIDAVGFNCGIGSAHLYEILKKTKLVTDKFVTAMPNSGYPEFMQDRTVYSGNSEYFAENVAKISELGWNILGGCCGTTPSYIKKVCEKIDYKNNRKHAAGTGTECFTMEEAQKTEKADIHENKFYQLMESGKKVITVELDPPYDANAQKIMDCAHLLKAAGVDMITFADSPMGKPRVDSIMMGIKVSNEVGIPVMPHIACRDKNVIAMRAGILGAYLNGIRNFLFVTGDPVPAENRSDISSVFDFNSIKLMQYVNEMNKEHFKEEPIYFGGALNYNRPNLDMEIKRMERKIEAGAKYFLTQPIFSKDDMERIRVVKEKTNTKILCGIMPLISYRNASFIKNEILGIHVPEEILARFEPEMTREEGEAVGVEIAKEVMQKLETVADGYYFMLPFNRVHLVEQILKK